MRHDPERSTVHWTDNGVKGTFTLDGHDLSHDLARDSIVISTQDRQVRVDARILARALDVTVQTDAVTIHTTPAQEALLKAAGWAKLGDVSVHGDVLLAQGSILNAIASHVAETYPSQAQALRDMADRLDAYVIPEQTQEQTHA